MKKIIFLLFFSLTVCLAVDQKKAALEVPSLKNQFFLALPTKDIYGDKIFYNKKLYLFDIWSITCPPCRMTTPELIKVQKSLGGIDFTIIGLNLDEDLSVIKEFLAKEKANYPTAQATREALGKFPPVRGIPTLFLVDSSGKIVKTYIGYTQSNVFEKDIKKLLKK